jgi:hypothetical protein
MPPNHRPTTSKIKIMEPQDKKSPENQDGFVIDVNYVPVSDLKTLLISGSLSTATPDRLINLFLYTERRAIPTKTSITVTPEGATESDDEFENGEGLIREITHSLLLDTQAAQALINGLTTTLNSLKKRIKEQDKKNQKAK